MKWIAGLLFVLGALALAASIVYFTVQAHSLPSVLGAIPLHHAGAHAHRTQRAKYALGGGILLWVVAVILLVVDRRSSRSVAD